MGWRFCIDAVGGNARRSFDSCRWSSSSRRTRRLATRPSTAPDDPRFLALGEARRTGTVTALIRSGLADKGLATRSPSKDETLSDTQDTEDVVEQASASAR